MENVNTMPSRMIYSDSICWITYFLAGSVGMLAEELIIKLVITTVSLVVASTVVFFYKKWLENKYKDDCKCDKKDE